MKSLKTLEAFFVYRTPELDNITWCTFIVHFPRNANVNCKLNFREFAENSTPIIKFKDTSLNLCKIFAQSCGLIFFFVQTRIKRRKNIKNFSYGNATHQVARSSFGREIKTSANILDEYFIILIYYDFLFLNLNKLS